MNKNLLQSLAAKLTKKEEHPADKFLREKREELQRKKEFETPREQMQRLLEEKQVPAPVNEVNIDFIDPIETDYSSMPLGQKEAQQANGVRNHGLLTGNFAHDKESDVVRFVEQPNGVVALSDPNNVTEAIKSVIDRRFTGLSYVGTCDTVIYKSEFKKGDEVIFDGKAKGVISKTIDFDKETKFEIDLGKGKTIWTNEPLLKHAEPEDYGQESLFESIKPDMPVAMMNDAQIKKAIENGELNKKKVPFIGYEYNPTESIYDGKDFSAAKLDEAVLMPTPMLSKALAQSEPSNEMIGDFKEKDDKIVFEKNPNGRWHLSNPPMDDTIVATQYAMGIDPARIDEDHKNELKIKFPSLVEEMVEVSKYYCGEKERIWVGIDPGKAGAIVALNGNGQILGKDVIPLIGNDVDAKGIYEILKAYSDKYEVTVVLEEVHSLHKMAAATNFSMGHTLGIILGIVLASSFKLIRVQPKAWQKEVWITSEIEYLPKKPEQKNPSINTKLTSMKAAHRLFPNADFRKSSRATNDHDGICDAVLIAEYARRKNL